MRTSLAPERALALGKTFCRLLRSWGEPRPLGACHQAVARLHGYTSLREVQRTLPPPGTPSPLPACPDVLAALLAIPHSMAQRLLNEAISSPEPQVPPWPSSVGTLVNPRDDNGFNWDTGSKVRRFGVPGIVRRGKGPDGYFDGTGSLSWKRRRLALPAPESVVANFFAETAAELGGAAAATAFRRYDALLAALGRMATAPLSAERAGAAWLDSVAQSYAARGYLEGHKDAPEGVLSLRVEADCLTAPDVAQATVSISKYLGIRSPEATLSPVPLTEPEWREKQETRYQRAFHDIAPSAPSAEERDYYAAASMAADLLPSPVERMWIITGAKSLPVGGQVYEDYVTSHARLAAGGELEVFFSEPPPLVFALSMTAAPATLAANAVERAHTLSASIRTAYATAHRIEAEAFTVLRKTAGRFPLAASGVLR